MSHNRDTIQTPIRLPLESLHKAIQVYGKVIPTPLFPVGIGTLDKERFNFQLVISRRYHNSPFGLQIITPIHTLLRSETQISILHCIP